MATKAPENLPGNVIKGPWKRKSKKDIVLPDDDIIELQENIMFCDNLTEGAIVQLIHTLGENGFEVNDEPFMRDVGFIIESVRGMLYRDMGIHSPMGRVMEIFTKTKAVTVEGETAGYDFHIDPNRISDLLEAFDDEEEDPKKPA
jgi:hypothetical protein